LPASVLVCLGHYLPQNNCVAVGANNLLMWQNLRYLEMRAAPEGSR
jgi:hypothetical protein